ncbi:MAG: four helix bundle protein [Deltaproteobacteria bacterium]|nr:four helix bundle protein [Deltaproteobacteria bacterium]
MVPQLKGKFGKDLGLKNQIQRAAVLVASNIAEGFERKTNKDFICKNLNLTKQTMWK